MSWDASTRDAIYAEGKLVELIKRALDGCSVNSSAPRYWARLKIPGEL